MKNRQGVGQDRLCFYNTESCSDYGWLNGEGEKINCQNKQYCDIAVLHVSSIGTTFLFFLMLITSVLIGALSPSDAYASYSISMTSSGAQNINVLANGTSIGVDNINITSDCRAGYNLSLSTSVSDNNLYLNGNSANNTSGTYFTPADGTSWSVIKNSDIDNDSIVLLSADDINTSRNVKISEVKNYLQNEYKNSIAEQLGSSVDVRLLTLDDVSELSGIASSSLVPGTSLENGITPDFLYETTTLISNDTNMLLGENPNMICEAVDASQFGSGDPARICMSTQTNTEPFRVVITMAKKDI